MKRNQMVYKTKKNSTAPCGNCKSVVEIVEWDYSTITGRPEGIIFCGNCEHEKRIIRR